MPQIPTYNFFFMLFYTLLAVCIIIIGFYLKKVFARIHSIELILVSLPLIPISVTTKQFIHLHNLDIYVPVFVALYILFTHYFIITYRNEKYPSWYYWAVLFIISLSVASIIFLIKIFLILPYVLENFKPLLQNVFQASEIAIPVASTLFMDRGSNAEASSSIGNSGSTTSANTNNASSVGQAVSTNTNDRTLDRSRRRYTRPRKNLVIQANVDILTLVEPIVLDTTNNSTVAKSLEDRCKQVALAKGDNPDRNRSCTFGDIVAKPLNGNVPMKISEMDKNSKLFWQNYFRSLIPNSGITNSIERKLHTTPPGRFPGIVMWSEAKFGRYPGNDILDEIKRRGL